MKKIAPGIWWVCGYDQGYRDGRDHEHYDSLFFNGPRGFSMRGDYGSYNFCEEDPKK